MIISAGTGELLSQSWVKPESLHTLHVAVTETAPAGLPDAQHYAQRFTLDAIASRQAELLRQKTSTPQALASRPVVLNNSRMLSTGASAKLLAHRSLPICILGYKNRNQQTDPSSTSTDIVCG